MIKLIKHVYDEEGTIAVAFLLGAFSFFITGLLSMTAFVYRDIHETVNQCQVQEVKYEQCAHRKNHD